VNIIATFTTIQKRTLRAITAARVLRLITMKQRRSLRERCFMAVNSHEAAYVHTQLKGMCTYAIAFDTYQYIYGTDMYYTRHIFCGY
jgi:hypothetical protein